MSDQQVAKGGDQPAVSDPQGGASGDGEGGMPRVKSEKELQKEQKRLEKLAKFEEKQKKKAEEAAAKKAKEETEVEIRYKN